MFLYYNKIYIDISRFFSYTYNNNCGTDCDNNHHKNIGRNLDFANDYISRDGKDMLLVATSSNTCLHGESGTLGLSFLGGDVAICRILQSRPDAVTRDVGNTRLIQHEFSHCFGVDSDNGSLNNCNNDAPCIMTSGFDDNRSYNLQNMWCPNCQYQFNRTKH